MTEVDSQKIVEKLTEVLELLKKEPEKSVEVVEKEEETKDDCCSKCPFKKMLMEECKKECKKTGECPKECVKVVKDCKDCVCKDCPCKGNKVIEDFMSEDFEMCQRDSICPLNGILFLLFLVIFIISLIRFIKCYTASGCSIGCT